MSWRKKDYEPFIKTPVIGHRWTERFSHVGVILDFNDYCVLWADKKIEPDDDGYLIDYLNPSIISRCGFEKIVRQSEILDPNKDYSKPYKELIEQNTLEPFPIPQSEEQMESFVEYVLKYKDENERKEIRNRIKAIIDRDGESISRDNIQSIQTILNAYNERKLFGSESVKYALGYPARLYKEFLTIKAN